jgi:hypothetical protein
LPRDARLAFSFLSFVSLSQRTLFFYEREGDDIPAGLVPPMANALDVSVDELLGETDKKRHVGTGPTGRIRRLFEAASKQPRSGAGEDTQSFPTFRRQRLA